MKKTYIQPNIKVKEITEQTSIMAASFNPDDPNPVIGTKPSNPVGSSDQIGSKALRYNIWDPEDMDEE